MRKVAIMKISWKKSRMWGMNPHLEGWTPDEDDCYRKHITCGGCGYDKLSSVVAEFINSSPTMLAKLQEMTAHPDGYPYGYTPNDKGEIRAEMCGVGLTSLFRGMEYVGLTVMHCEGEIYDHIEISGEYEPQEKVQFYELARSDYESASRYIINARLWGSRQWPKDMYSIVRRMTRKVKKLKGKR